MKIFGFLRVVAWLTWFGFTNCLKNLSLALWEVTRFMIQGPEQRTARFMPPLQRWLWLDSQSRGLLLNGKSARLPLDLTYQGSLLQGGMGTGF